MVASLDPGEVGEKLDHMEKNLPKLPTNEGRKVAVALFKTARGQVDKITRAMKLEITQDQSNADSRSTRLDQRNKFLVKIETSLVETLIALFLMFKNKGELTNLLDSKIITVESRKVKADIEAFLRLSKTSDEMSKWVEISDANTLWTRIISYAESMPTGSPLNKYYDKPVRYSGGSSNDYYSMVNKSFDAVVNLKMVKETKRKKDDKIFAALSTADQEAIIENRKSVINGKDENGSAIRNKLKQYLFGEVKIIEIKHLFKDLVSNYYKLSGGSNDHNFFQDKNLDVSGGDRSNLNIRNGVLNLRYKYDNPWKGTGDDKLIFHVEVRVQEGQDILQTVRGQNLRRKVEDTRGYTVSSGDLSSEDFVNRKKERISDMPHKGFHSAHILGDMFTGSGYKSHLNLIVTSRNYNAVKMYDKEKHIMNQMKTTPENVDRIDLTVSALWRVFIDENIIDQLKTSVDKGLTKGINNKFEKFRDDLREDAFKEAYEYLAKKQDPRLVLDVKYELFHNTVTNYVPMKKKTIGVHDEDMAVFLGLKSGNYPKL